MIGKAPGPVPWKANAYRLEVLFQRRGIVMRHQITLTAIACAYAWLVPAACARAGVPPLAGRTFYLDGRGTFSYLSIDRQGPPSNPGSFTGTFVYKGKTMTVRGSLIPIALPPAANSQLFSLKFDNRIVHNNLLLPPPPGTPLVSFDGALLSYPLGSSQLVSLELDTLWGQVVPSAGVGIQRRSQNR
jgi:hypothetical protein